MILAHLYADIRALMNSHYGMPMRFTVQSRDEHSLGCLEEHLGMDYYDRLIDDWDSETGPCLDIILWDHTTNSLQLVQSLCFKDAYVTRSAWLYAIRHLIRENASVWVVSHIE